MLNKFFQDSNGLMSWGRLAASFCLIVVFLVFLGGVIYPSIQDYAGKTINSLLLSASAFYGSSKVTQGIEAFAKPTPCTSAEEVSNA